jgi:serine/threonine-protein kinase HipA
MNGELVGYWTMGPQARHEFQYTEEWLTDPRSRPISLSMPLRPADAPYQGDRVEAFFDNLLPDSVEIRRRIQSRFGAASTRAFDLLTEIGRDCVGALQLLTPDAIPDDIKCITSEPLTEAGVAQLLREATTAPKLGQREDDAFRISLAGAQEKTALLRHDGQWHRPTGATPTTHIFKLPSGKVGNMQADLSTSVENEWLCAQIVRAYGLDVANCDIAQFEDQRTLIVERFDRKPSPDHTWWLRLPLEDMCQATGTPPEQRYESDGGPGVSEIMSVLLGARNAHSDRRGFFKARVLFWMLCAPDGHAKNFSVFIEPKGRYSSSPLYDIISAYPIVGTGANQLAPQRVRLAMAVSGKNKHYRWSMITRRHFSETARMCDMSSEANDVIDELVEATPQVIRKIMTRLPEGFPASVAEPIIAGLSDAAKKLSIQ